MNLIKFLLFVLLLLMFLDVVTTVYLSGLPGFYEMNPLWVFIS